MRNNSWNKNFGVYEAENWNKVCILDWDSDATYQSHYFSTPEWKVLLGEVLKLSEWSDLFVMILGAFTSLWRRRVIMYPTISISNHGNLFIVRTLANSCKAMCMYVEGNCNLFPTKSFLMICMIDHNATYLLLDFYAKYVLILISIAPSVHTYAYV